MEEVRKGSIFGTKKLFELTFLISRRYSRRNGGLGEKLIGATRLGGNIFVELCLKDR